MAHRIRHPAPDNLAQLTGSSAPMGEPPTFKPIAAAAAPAAVPPEPAVPPAGDLVHALIKAHEDAYAAWTAAMPAGLPNSGPIADAKTATLQAVVAAKPTTIPGLKAWIKHLHFVITEAGDWSAGERAFPQLVAAAEALLWSEPRYAGFAADAELLDLGRQWRAAMAAHSATQDTGIGDLARLAELEAVAAKIVTRPAKTLAGLEVKAAVAASCSIGDRRAMIAGLVRSGGPLGLPAAWSIVSDLGEMDCSLDVAHPLAGGEPDTELIALGRELDALHAEALLAEDLDDDELDRFDAIRIDKESAIVERIEPLRASTVAGLQVKLKAFLSFRIEGAPELSSDNSAERALASLMESLERMATSRQDAELLALGRALRQREEAIVEPYELEGALQTIFEASEPPIPDALMCVNNPRLARGERECALHGDAAFYSAYLIACFRTTPRTMLVIVESARSGAGYHFERRPDPEAQARAEAAIAAYDAWKAQCDQLRETIGLGQATLVCDGIGREREELEEKILARRATSLAGLAVKARVILNRDEDEKDRLLEELVAVSGLPEETLPEGRQLDRGDFEEVHDADATAATKAAA